MKKIVSICPHCVRTIADDWKEFGAHVEIEHHSEFMARYQDKLPSGKPVSASYSTIPAILGATGTFMMSLGK